MAAPRGLAAAFAGSPQGRRSPACTAPGAFTGGIALHTTAALMWRGRSRLARFTQRALPPLSPTSAGPPWRWRWRWRRRLARRPSGNSNNTCGWAPLCRARAFAPSQRALKGRPGDRSEASAQRTRPPASRRRWAVALRPPPGAPPHGGRPPLGWREEGHATVRTHPSPPPLSSSLQNVSAAAGHRWCAPAGAGAAASPVALAAEAGARHHVLPHRRGQRRLAPRLGPRRRGGNLTAAFVRGSGPTGPGGGAVPRRCVSAAMSAQRITLFISW